MTKDGKINKTELAEKIVRVIKTVYDPEIPVDVYELGLIYDVFVNEDYGVKILMTLKLFLQVKLILLKNSKITTFRKIFLMTLKLFLQVILKKNSKEIMVQTRILMREFYPIQVRPLH